MSKDSCILGIDTSNYRTSVALADKEGVICDHRMLLDVKHGHLGLRQSEALFQHVNNLPLLFKRLGNDYSDKIAAVSCSAFPRRVEGSYMPCFLAGKSMAHSIGSLLGVPVMEFSHQEGHIEAVRHFSVLDHESEFIACHFSGGTCEVLDVKQFSPARKSEQIYDITITGGTKDISFGQVLDRAGVEMGLQFPCGEEMDRIACTPGAPSHVLKPVKVTENCRVNLSGIETQIKKNIGTTDRDMLIREIFVRLSDAAADMLRAASEKTGKKTILLSGGVASSAFIKKRIDDRCGDLNLIYDERGFSSDNAAGIALLGGRVLWG